MTDRPESATYARTHVASTGGTRILRKIHRSICEGRVDGTMAKSNDLWEVPRNSFPRPGPIGAFEHHPKGKGTRFSSVVEPLWVAKNVTTAVYRGGAGGKKIASAKHTKAKPPTGTNLGIRPVCRIGGKIGRHGEENSVFGSMCSLSFPPPTTQPSGSVCLVFWKLVGDEIFRRRERQAWLKLKEAIVFCNPETMSVGWIFQVKTLTFL